MFTFYLSEANTHTCTAHTCSIKNTHSYIKNIFKILEKKNMKINKDMFKILFKKKWKPKRNGKGIFSRMLSCFILTYKINKTKKKKKEKKLNVWFIVVYKKERERERERERKKTK